MGGEEGGEEGASRCETQHLGYVCMRVVERQQGKDVCS